MSDVGMIALRFSLLVAVIGLGTGIYAGISRRDNWTQVTERCVGLVFLLTTISMAALFYCLAYNDFQLAYVAQNTARSMARFAHLFDVPLTQFSPTLQRVIAPSTLNIIRTPNMSRH